MKTKHLLAAAAMLLSAVGAARAEDGPYVASSVSAFLGSDYSHHPAWSAAKGDSQNKFAGGLAAGYRLDDYRFELEGTYGRIADIDGTLTTALKTKYPTLTKPTGDVTLWTAMAGAYVDLPVTAKYQPYVGLGGGVAHLDNDAGLLAINNGTHAAAFGEAGLNIALFDGLTIAPGYRYLWINAKGDGADNVSTHIVKLTARVSF